jgi:hypothetical protein
MPAKMNRPHGGLLHLYRHYMQFDVTYANTVTSPQFGRRPNGFITKVSQAVALPRVDIELSGFGNQGNDAEILRRSPVFLQAGGSGFCIEPFGLLEVDCVGFIVWMESAGQWITAVFCAIPATHNGLTAACCDRCLLSPENHG